MAIDPTDAMSRSRRRLLLALLAAALTLAGADLAVSLFVLQDGLFRGRPLPPFGALPHPRQREWLDAHLELLAAGELRQSPLGRFDRELGWTNEPSSRLGDRHFNSLGARGRREYGARPEPGVTRLVCFGDSFTYGAEVPDGDDWCAQLEARGGRYEALNFGVGAYGTDQALLRFRRRGHDLGAHVVVIGFLVENAGRNVNRYRPLYYPRTRGPGVKPRFVLRGDELAVVGLPFDSLRELIASVEDDTILERVAEHEYWLDRPALGWARRSSLARLGAGWLAYTWRRPQYLLGRPGDEPFRVTLALLESFHAEALESGAQRAVVLIFPRRTELDALLSDNKRYWDLLTAALSERGIPHLDLSRALRDPYARSLQDPERPSLFQGAHLSREGNRIVAEELAAWLETGEE